MRPILCCVAVATLAGCTVGPDHRPPIVAGADCACPLGEGAPEAATSAVFGDPVLGALVRQALAANRDIAVAEARLREARAGRDVAAGGRLPDVQAAGSVARRRLARRGEVPFDRLPGIANEYSLFDGGFDAAWEIDLWGGRKRAVQSATATLAAATAGAAETRSRIVAEVVRNYARLRAVQADAVTLAAEGEALDQLTVLYRDLARAGETTSETQDAARADRHRIEAERIEAEAQGVDLIATLALLSGRLPEQVRAALTPAAVLPRLPDRVGLGMRSAVLRRRPDVAAAEAELAAATADIGVATAQLFPQFSLLGGVGVQSRTPDGLASSDALRFGIGPSLRWPIFSAGRIRAQIRSTTARADAAAARYEQAILTALAESETTINRYNVASAISREQRLAENALADAAGQVERRFDAGDDSRVTMLTARVRRLEAARVTQASAAQRLIAYAALYKALGLPPPEAAD